MNRKLGLTLLSSALVAITLAGISDARSGHARPVSPILNNHESGTMFDPDEDAEIVRKLAKYKTWTLVNPSPVLMDANAAFACAAVISTNPHATKYISVYVNKKGQEAMLRQQRPVFPVGSVIVKEKLTYSTARSPELLTVMIKREKGYDENSGNWEYLVLDGSAATITQRGRLKSCNGCHIGYTQTDYVTRTYLPENVRKELQ